MNEEEQQQPRTAKRKKPGKPSRADARKILHQAIDNEVCENSDRFAKSLMQSAIDGNMQGARLLLDTMKDEKKSGGKVASAKKPARMSRADDSPARRLACEAQCTADDEEALEKAEADQARSQDGSES